MRHPPGTRTRSVRGVAYRPGGATPRSSPCSPRARPAGAPCPPLPRVSPSSGLSAEPPVQKGPCAVRAVLARISVSGARPTRLNGAPAPTRSTSTREPWDSVISCRRQRPIRALADRTTNDPAPCRTRLPCARYRANTRCVDALRQRGRRASSLCSHDRRAARPTADRTRPCRYARPFTRVARDGPLRGWPGGEASPAALALTGATAMPRRVRFTRSTRC
jgi:hypothetical protein